jgi:hypothetical protein
LEIAERARYRHRQCIAVGIRLGAHLGAEHGASTGPVVDDDLLAPVLAHFLRDDAREYVGRCAGCELHDDVDRLRRKFAGGGGRCRQQCGGEDKNGIWFFHAGSSGGAPSNLLLWRRAAVS